MKKLRWQIAIVAVALIAIAIVIYGKQPGIHSILPAPSAGGTYTEALIGSPVRFNPLLDYYNQPDRDVDRLIFSSLIKFDSWGNPIPELAEKIGISLSGQVYNITLKENSVWHDGQPVTSADVEFTIDLMRDDSIPLPEDVRTLWNSIEVEIFDKFNLQFRLSEPYAPFIDYLAFGILPEHLLKGKSGEVLINSAFNLEPVGSGPFKFEELLIEDGVVVGVVLKAFDEFYNNRPLIDQVVIRYYENSADAYQAFVDGEVQGISSVDMGIIRQVLAEDGLDVYSSRYPQICLVLLNLGNDTVPFFQEVNVRKALMAGINRSWIIDMVLDGQAIVADSPIFPGSWAYYDNIERFSYNPNEAVRLLREAEYVIPAEGGIVRKKDGLSLSFDLIHLDDEIHEKIANIIKENWADIGVNVNLTAVDSESLLKEYLEPRSYEAVLVDWSFTRTPDPDPYPFWHQSQTTGGQNYSMWNDRRASEYLENARVTINHEERIRLYRNFQVHFNHELPALPLFYPIYSYAVSQSVTGVSVGPLYDPSDRFANILEWHFVTIPEPQEDEPVVIP